MNKSEAKENITGSSFALDDELLKLTLDWIDRLASEIGPRASGSHGEKKALQIIDQYLASIGYQTEWQHFRFPNLPRYYPYLSIIGIFLIIGGNLEDWQQIILIAAPFMVAALPEFSHWLANRFPGKKESANLVVKPNGKNLQDLDYLLVAHVDSARIVPKPPAFLRGFFQNLMVIIEGCAWAAALFGILSVTQPILSATLQPAIRGFLMGAGTILLIIDLWQQLAHAGQVTSGANDNASGVAAMIAFATVLQNQTTSKPVVGFLFTGAEEEGLFGARAFVKQNLSGSYRVINLDMVGQGSKVGLVSRAGRLKPVATDSYMNNLAERFSQKIYKVDYRYRAGDFVPFLKAGIPAISIEATDHGAVPPTYHQASDNADAIQPEIIREILKVVYQIIQH